MLLKNFIDVKRVFKEKTANFTKIPSNILRINCFYEGVEIAISQPSQKNPVISLLKDWFGTWLDEKRPAILLDINDAVLPIEFIEDETRKYENQLNRPFWHENAYRQSNSDQANQPVLLPTKSFDSLKMAVFHSFKGGMGCTTHLVAYLLALLELAKELKPEVNILVIDADLEAPGLSYWQCQENLEPSVSLIDFLETYHYPPTNREAVIACYAKELKRTQHPLGFYLLPAFLTEGQLLDLEVLPEHLIRDSDDMWEYSQAFAELALALEASFVLIDLRAGLSELTSPLLFDPRLERYLVTTLSEQSVSGTCLVLDLLARMMPEEGKYLDPIVVISMIPPELVTSSIYTENTQRLLASYSDRITTDDILPRLQVEETHFAQELLLLSGWNDARQKLAGTSMMKRAKQWAKEALFTIEVSSSSSTNTQYATQSEPLEAVERLNEFCKKYEYAENSESDALLITEPLRNLAKNHTDKLPQVVSIGAKGAGKTFNYLQLVNSKRWYKFLQKISIPPEKHHNAFIVPLWQSKNLAAATQESLRQAREVFLQTVNNSNSWSLNQLTDEITAKLSQNLTELEWRIFWIDTLGKLINNSYTSTPQANSPTPTSKLTEIDAYLKRKNWQVIFLFDGLEERFPEVAKESAQRSALQALLELPNYLNEIRQANLGVIIFLRRDLVRYVIPQNVGQFERRYEAYDLSWNFKSFLQLVYWICAQINVIGATDNQVYELATEDLRQQLELFWGKRLGTDASKDAYTVRWIYAALTDFKGKLQARDIVRLLSLAAEYTLNNREILEKWQPTRLLPPVAIRKSIAGCSEKKVEEANNEYPEAFKTWVSELLKLDQEQRQIPFNPQDFAMEPSTIEILQNLGVIYEDTKAEGKARFYIPEIFRAGLGFEHAGTARPRIIALKRQILKEAGGE
jgi:MinD-like ATPase involved in chromosome partitioning or flagellar assembly